MTDNNDEFSEEAFRQLESFLESRDIGHSLSIAISPGSADSAIIYGDWAGRRRGLFIINEIYDDARHIHTYDLFSYLVPGQDPVFTQHDGVKELISQITRDLAQVRRGQGIRPVEKDPEP